MVLIDVHRGLGTGSKSRAEAREVRTIFKSGRVDDDALVCPAGVVQGFFDGHPFVRCMLRICLDVRQSVVAFVLLAALAAYLPDVVCNSAGWRHENLMCL